MDTADIQAATEKFGTWYHSMVLAAGLPPTESYIPGIANQWAQTRRVRQGVDYTGKNVLDLGTMDGMWAFEAESLGAKCVLAADVWENPRLEFAKKTLNSKVIIACNADVHCLVSRLRETMDAHRIGSFDIIQCLGLLYHVQNPFLALHQIRGLLAPDGVMLLETAIWGWAVTSDPPAARLNRNPQIYGDNSTYWMPNFVCLKEMLAICGFSMREDTMRNLVEHQSSRVCVWCNAEPVVAKSENWGTI